MNIKARTMKLKTPNLLFNRVYSNSALIMILSFTFLNYIWGYMGYNSFGFMAVFLINFLFTIFAAFAAVIQGEAMKEPGYDNREDNREENKSDFKRMGIYLVFYTIVVLTINTIFPPVHVPTVNKHVEIMSVKIIDVHNRGKDNYSIRYFDKEGNTIFTDTYAKEVDRTAVFNKIFDASGHVVVTMDYYKQNGKEFVEISAKAIEL